MTTISEWLNNNTDRLYKTGIGTARLDCLVLLEDITGKTRAWMLAHTDFELSDSQLEKLDTAIVRRLDDEPMAHIRGVSEFYGRQFSVDRRALEPRPESEAMIDLLLSLPEAGKTITVADIGTGSGALAITAKLELTKAEVIATEISYEALELARKNADKHGVEIDFYQGDLLLPLRDTATTPLVILCNLPYVPDDYPINRSAAREPREAIFAGSDGLDLYRKLFEQLDKFSPLPKAIITESLPFQHQGLASLAQSNGFQLKDSYDLVQIFTR